MKLAETSFVKSQPSVTYMTNLLQVAFYSKFYQGLQHQKTRVSGLLCGVVFVIFSPFGRTPTCDGRTDRQTHGDASKASRGVFLANLDCLNAVVAYGH